MSYSKNGQTFIKKWKGECTVRTDKVHTKTAYVGKSEVAKLRLYKSPDRVENRHCKKCQSDSESDHDDHDDRNNHENKCINRDYHKESEYIRCKLGELEGEKCCPHVPHKSESEKKYDDHNYNGSFHKGLEHNTTDGRLVDDCQYKKLVRSVRENDQKELNEVKLDPHALGKLTNPLASLATPLLGKPTCLLHIDDPPILSSDAGAAEMVEVYSLAVCRDVPFVNYDVDGTITTILDNTHMNSPDVLASLKYYAPANTPITPQTLFRGTTPSEQVGPYISQFLLLNVPMGDLSYPQLYNTPDSRTVAQGIPTRVEWGVSTAETIDLENTEFNLLPPPTLPANISPKYLFSGRGLAEAVHMDAAYQFYFQAANILMALGADVNPGFPTYSNQAPFPTGTGAPSILCAIGEVTGLAFKHAWYWKWQVFRKLRPEVFALWVSDVKNSLVPNAGNFDISNVVLNNGVLTDIVNVNNSWGSASSYTLPIAFREGSPLHPTYPSGHAVVAGACCTILKMFFDADKPWASLPGLQVGNINRVVLPNPLNGPVIEANVDGTSLQDYAGADESSVTIIGEINKLASNVATGRNWAGIHFRSDAEQGIALGEQVAIAYMEDVLSAMVDNYVDKPPCEPVYPAITFTKFDGLSYTVIPKVCKKHHH